MLLFSANFQRLVLLISVLLQYSGVLILDTFYKTGHCLALTENGILNQDECHYFSKGCPSGDYYSNESYKCMYTS